MGQNFLRSKIFGLSAFVFLFSSNVVSLWAETSSAYSKAPSGLIAFLRGETWKNFMEIFNLLVLLWLFWRYLMPLIFSALDKGISEIEYNLSEAERLRVEYDDKISKLKQKIGDIDTKRQELLKEAEEGALVLKENILANAREAELSIIKHVEWEVAEYRRNWLNRLKDDLFHKSENEFRENLGSQKGQSKVLEFSKGLIKKIGVSGEE